MMCENCICCIKVYGNKSCSGADILASRCLIVMLLSVFIIEQVCVETRSSDHGMTLAARCCALPPPADIDRCLPPAPELQRWCLVMGDYFDPSCASTWVAVGARPRGVRRLYATVVFGDCWPYVKLVFVYNVFTELPFWRNIVGDTRDRCACNVVLFY